MHRRTDNKHGASNGKRRKVIKDEMLSSENNKQSEDESISSLSLRQALYEIRKPQWDALFEKYELQSEEDLEDCISLANESGNWKECEFRSKLSAMKVKNWHVGFNSSSISSKDQNEQLAEVEAAEKNEFIRTVENKMIDERPMWKSRSVFSGDSHIGKKDKVKRVKEEDINQNVHQLHSRKEKEDDFEKERRDDATQDFISNGVIKKRQESTCESRSFQNTNNFDQLHQHENSRVNVLCNESNNIMENPITDKCPAQKSGAAFSGDSNIGKKDKIECVKKDINQNVYQLRSRKNREDSFEKERDDVNQDFISNGVIKKRQKSTCESRSFQNTNNFDRLRQHENSRVNVLCSESNNIVENPIIDKCPAQKSRSVFSGDSNIGKKDKIKCVKKDINQNVYQLRSRKNKEDSFEKERRDDATQDLISNDVVKKHQEKTCESRTFQNTNNFERLHGHENFSRVHVNRNESDFKSFLEVHLEKQEHVKKTKINPTIHSKHISEEMKKEYSKGDLKFLNVKNSSKNISQNSPRTKLGIAPKVNKQNCIIRNEKCENTAHYSSLSDLNFSIDSMYTDSEDFSLKTEKIFEKPKPKNIQHNSFVMFPKEMGREMSEWSTEFSNFIKYQWNDFRKNPGSMLFPLPKLKSSGWDEKLSWQNIMNGN